MTENSDYQLLTKGALGHMLEGTKIEDPVVQLLGYKNMKVTSEKRFRVILSDGAYSYQCCVITGDLASMIEEKRYEQYDLLKILEYSVITSKDRLIIIPTKMELVKKGSGKRLGNPVVVGSADAPPLSDFQPNYHLNVNNDDMDMDLENLSLDQSDWPQVDQFQQTGVQPQASTSNADRKPPAIRPEHVLDSKLVRPINVLHQYMTNWTIKGRCTMKTNKRTWKNQRSEGTFFTFTLADSNCEIEITAFRAECDKYFLSITTDEIYLVSGGLVKARRKGSKTRSEYCIVLNASSIIERCDDESGCPPISYDFKRIDQLDRAGAFFDLVAIVKSVGSAETVVSRNTQQPLVKRSLTVLDDSEKEVTLTLWDQTATDFAGKEGDVITGRNLKVSEFDGLCLSTTSNSRIKLNQDSNRAHQLRAWYASVKNTLQTTALTKKEVNSFPVAWYNLDKISLKNVENRPFTFQTKAVISMTGKTIFYLGCKACNKMLENCANGLYRCERCKKESNEFNYRIILSFCISDHTQSVWVQAFHAESLQLLGRETNLDELYNLYKNQPSEFEDRIRSYNHMSLVFLLKSSLRLYNNEHRVCTQITGFHAINHREYGHVLLKQIKS